MPAHLLYPGVLPNVMSPLYHTLSTGTIMIVAASKVDVTTRHPNGYGYVTGDNLVTGSISSSPNPCSSLRVWPLLQRCCRVIGWGAGNMLHDMPSPVTLYLHQGVPWSNGGQAFGTDYVSTKPGSEPNSQYLHWPTSRHHQHRQHNATSP